MRWWRVLQVVEGDDEIKGFMYDTDNDASISGKSSDHFGWDWTKKDSPDTEVDWQDDIFHETEDVFIRLDQAIEDVVAKEVMEMANDQDEAPSDQEVADDPLVDEHVEEKRPSKRIKVTQEEMVMDEKQKKSL
ncbi:hypothetical protein Tco_0161982 [Tanacetum coccineum]